MNYKTSNIKAEQRKTFFAAHPHTAITINDELLDVLLDEQYPEENYLGLIPTLLPVLSNPAEKKMVWERFKVEAGKPKMVPVLMCPEDLDLSCTTLMVKVIVHDDYIIWEKFGIDVSDADGFPDNLGTKVEWLKKIKPMYFKKDEYLACIREFEIMHSEA